jgi:hypothetical protein
MGGNCERCIREVTLEAEHEAKRRKGDADKLAPGIAKRRKALEEQAPVGSSGVVLPVLDPFYAADIARPPCGRCAKMNLMPPEKGGMLAPFGGLHPKNVMAVRLYRMARRDQRDGMSAVLTSTVSATDIWHTLDAFSIEIGGPLARRNLFEKIKFIDWVATDERFRVEEQQRAAKRGPSK